MAISQKSRWTSMLMLRSHTSFVVTRQLQIRMGPRGHPASARPRRTPIGRYRQPRVRDPDHGGRGGGHCALERDLGRTAPRPVGVQGAHRGEDDRGAARGPLLRVAAQPGGPTGHGRRHLPDSRRLPGADRSRRLEGAQPERVRHRPGLPRHRDRPRAEHDLRPQCEPSAQSATAAVPERRLDVRAAPQSHGEG